MIVFQLASALPRPLAARRLDTIAELLSKKLKIRREEVVGIRFVTPRTIQTLNTDYRHKSQPTDVLSFKASTPWSKLAPEIGDIVICPSYAAKEAKRRGLSAEEELVRLVIHGTLHLKGYDHVTEAEEFRMFSLQEQLVEACLA
jgi:probable rRNA maturation factor